MPSRRVAPRGWCKKEEEKKEYPLDARPQAGCAYVAKSRNQPMTLRGGIIQKTTRATAPVKTRKKTFCYYYYYIIIIITAFIGQVSKTNTCQRTTTTNIRKNLYLTLCTNYIFPKNTKIYVLQISPVKLI